ncbi:hypothetical protein SKAU_G00348820 [Synaphobranchus kaupii]|uniref:Uncharacterized protein n=1 Tax=Synaphobranchus kaupii TaxID=118154 RepID=A0A9Q1EJW9_SYNKA|nr:hypothetical protein SKAU_G00348820 [Synaphobranchus kaupii]
MEASRLHYLSQRVIRGRLVLTGSEDIYEALPALAQGGRNVVRGPSSPRGGERSPPSFKLFARHNRGEESKSMCSL